MKKILLIFMAVAFMISCTKTNIIEDINTVEQNLPEASVAVIGVGGGGFENPFPPVVVALPPTVLTLTNGSYPMQLSKDTINNLTPNSVVFSNGQFNFFDNSYVGIRCPIPQPPPQFQIIYENYKHPFFWSNLVGVVGGNPLPGCPIIPNVFSQISFRLEKISSVIIRMNIKFNANNALIYSKDLTLTGPRTYYRAGDMGIANKITTLETSAYNNLQNQANITPIVRKFFNFFTASLSTSN
jgi:hypothetical protein